jgi:hypothetical protein
MYQSDQASLSWTQIAFGIVASFIGGGGAYKLFNIWLNRKKPAAEIGVHEATAVKTRAEARKIHAEADVQLNTVVERFLIRIDEMTVKADAVRIERDDYKMRYDLQQIELRLRDAQIKKMKGVLDLKGIKLSDFDEPKE